MTGCEIMIIVMIMLSDHDYDLFYVKNILSTYLTATVYILANASLCRPTRVCVCFVTVLELHLISTTSEEANMLTGKR